jgi:putative methionine-R-sulfoxide reductase with GAF domain
MTSSAELLALLGTSWRSEEKVLKLLIELGAQVVDASEGSLLIYDPAKNDLVFAMTVGGPPALLGHRVPLDRGLTGLAAATREVQIGAPTFNVLGTTSNSAGEPEAVIAAPMLIADELVGVITAVSFKPGKRFSLHDAELYGRMASVAGVVVDQGHRLRANDSQVDSAATRDPGILASLQSIARRGPEVMACTARILSEIDALSAPIVREG